MGQLAVFWRATASTVLLMLCMQENAQGTRRVLALGRLGQMRRAARVDANHTAIVEALRKVGCQVLSLAAVGKGCPDLLVCSPKRRLFLLEVKDGSKPPSKRKLTDPQVQLHETWPVGMALCAEGAVAIMQAVDSARY